MAVRVALTITASDILLPPTLVLHGYLVVALALRPPYTGVNLFVISVKTATGLASQVTGGDHLAYQNRRDEARVLQFGIDGVGDEKDDIQSGEIRQRERAHRVVQSVHDGGINIFFSGHSAFVHAN